MITLRSRTVAVALVLSVFALACATAIRDRAVVYTEAGITAAAEQWHNAHAEALDECRSKFAPQTPGAEQCFGAYHDADAKVEAAVRSSVAILRSYWTARAAGVRPGADWAETGAHVAAILRDLPPPARQYFERTGLPQ